MKGIIIQYLCSIILTIPGLQSAFTIVWPSYAIPILQSDESPLGYKISEVEASLISSFNMLTPMIASMFAGTLADKFGRKKISILCGLIFLISWTLVLTAKSASQILAGRLIAGLGSGSGIIVVIVYISELCQASTRPTATALISFLYSSGSLVSYTLGWVCSYNVVCYFSITLSMVYLVFVVGFVKETPVYLIGKGKEKEALNSLKFYRGTSITTQEIMDELSYIRSQHKQNKHDYVEKTQINETETINEEQNQSPKEQNAWKLLFKTRSSRHALISQVVIMVLMVSMGMMCVQVYAAKLFTRMAPNLSPDLCSVIMALVLVISSCVGTFIVNLFKRRILLISSIVISSWCMALLGSTLRWSWASDWTVTIIVVVFCFSFQVGPSTIPFVLTAESFGPQVKAVASQTVIAAMCFTNFLQLLLFTPIVAQIDLDGMFFLFACIGFFATVVVYFIMKETKGRLLEEIQEMYEKGFYNKSQ